jgi:hypothetical protein
LLLFVRNVESRTMTEELLKNVENYGKEEDRNYE